MAFQSAKIQTMRIILHTWYGETHIESEDIKEIRANTNSYGKSIIFYQTDKGKIRKQIVKETPKEIKAIMKKVNFVVC